MNKHKDTMHYYLQFDENGKQTTYLTEKNRLEGFVYYKAPQDFNPLKDLCFLKDGIVVLNKGSLIKKTQEEREQRIVDKQIAMLKMFSDSNEFRTISLDHNNIEILIVNNGDFRSILLEQKNLLEDKITPKTKAIFISPVLGNPPDMDAILDIASRYNLEILIDGCDSLGSTWDGRHLNEFAAATSCSFYPAHHITTGEGGTVSSAFEELIDTARSIAWWGRDCYCIGVSNLAPKGTCGCRIKKWLDNVDVEIDHKYVFTNMGYNLKPLDLQGNIGLEQLKKIDIVHQKRRDHKDTVQHFFNKIEGVKEVACHSKANPSWFGVPIICKDAVLKQRLVAHLEDNNVQTRTYFAGNILLHPGYAHLGDWREYPKANEVLYRVFFVGCSPTYTPGILNHIEKVVADFS